ncbi:MAG: hypothetical protein KatS3mg030_101 [Saprospiraceae bacterium]|nr:MAG: hypothetical protein KatS3mg030_101 [Saprospiraceae bacterium]
MNTIISDKKLLETALERHTIGSFVGNEPGPLFICTAAMHGNEWAGVRAVETVLTLLQREPLVNPGFSYRGVFLGLLGNAQAYALKRRFIQEDLNRMWTPQRIAKVRNTPWQSLEAEERELLELLTVIEHYIGTFEPMRIVLLDLHTTSAQGGIFVIATDHPESVRIAMELHAPVITGMLEGLQGTTLHYFTRENFKVPTVGVAFEAGQHDDPLSVNRSISAIINCMRSIRAVRPEDVENRHDALLIEYSKDLPRLARLVTVHHIRPEDQFRMMPGFRNFQPVHKGQLLAVDIRGPIFSPIDGMILMPLYQPQGTDGFFLIQRAL